jgi:hypothetical protein
MSEEGWIKLAEIASGIVIATLATIKVALTFWLTAKKEEIEHRAALEAENLKLKKENIDKSFDQLKEADRFIRLALVEVAKGLKETVQTTVEFGQQLREIRQTTSQEMRAASDEIKAVVKQLDQIEFTIKSVKKDIGEGNVRISEIKVPKKPQS